MSGFASQLSRVDILGWVLKWSGRINSLPTSLCSCLPFSMKLARYPQNTSPPLPFLSSIYQILCDTLYNWLLVYISCFFPPHPHSQNTPRGLGSVLLLSRYLNGAWPIGGMQTFVDWMSGNNKIIHLYGYCEASGRSDTGSAYLAQCQPRGSVKISTSDGVDFVIVKSHYKILECPVIAWLNHNAHYTSYPSLLNEIGISDTLGARSISALLPLNP